jgi:hypothetical protein
VAPASSFPVYNATTTPKGVKTPGWYPIDNLPTFVGDVPSALLKINVEYQLGATTGTPAVIMNEMEDFENWRNPSTNPSRLTSNYEGFYRLTVLSHWDANSGGVRQLRVRKNGAYVKSGQPSVAPDSPFNGHASNVFYVEMNGTTDYLEIGVIHSGTADINYSSTVHLEYVRPIHHA